jgi:23S rRNA (guanine745-N1)-methyltransferase
VLTDLLPYLRCPACAEPMTAAGQAVRCQRGHAFDVARQGYVNLAAGRVTHPGDTAAMVGARARWLAGGAYDFLSAELAAQVSGVAGLVLDAGAGTGHHLARVLDANPDAVGLAVDVSKPAVRRAARAHPRAAAVLADSWQRLPVGDHTAAVVLNVFAPRNGAEFYRVLCPDGALLVVTPEPGHLGELVDTLGLLRVPPEKADRVAAGLTPWFRAGTARVLTRTLRLSRAQVHTLVEMGPSAHHTDPQRLVATVATLAEPVLVTASVRLSRYHPAREGAGQVDRSISSQPRGGS